MKVRYYVFSVFMVLLSSGCCSDIRRLNNPERPLKILGEEDFRNGNTDTVGVFLLNKGQSMDNGKMGIRFVEAYPGTCGDLFREQVYPQAKLQFYRVSDQAILCEYTFFRGASLTLSPPICKADLDWSSIGIGDISSKENWVTFVLTKKEDFSKP
jgi:hypothetical protein